MTPSPRESETEPAPSSARVIAELQALAIGIHLVGLDRLPEVMAASKPIIVEPEQ